MVNISEVVNELKDTVKYNIKGPDVSEKVYRLKKDIFKNGKYDDHIFDKNGDILERPDITGMLDKLDSDLCDLIADLSEAQAWREGYADGMIDCLSVSNLKTLQDLGSLTVKD